ncbi:MAG: metallophosphoesterase [Sandaracinaceae bacterium]|nr:metallophosphoesterase [Sandaracinaceae bacterium]
MRRRDFLRRSLGAGAGLFLPAQLLGCDGDPSPLDAGFDAHVEPRPDAGSPLDFRGLTKGPWVQLTSPGRAHLRFETYVDAAVPVRIGRASGDDAPEAAQRGFDVRYERDALGMAARLPDFAGRHVLHEVVLEDLAPGEQVEWTVTPAEGPPVSGSFLASPETGTPFSFAWLADTSVPFSDPSVELVARHAPDLVLHGGDITYAANPFDTWNAMMRGFSPITQQAAFMVTIGNHEFDMAHEVDHMYDRLFGGQGAPGASPRHFAYTFGGIRFIHLDSETSSLATDAAQLAWLDAELEAARADADVRFPVLAFHRPTYTFSRHAPGSLAQREAVHTRCVEHGVPLVLAGHVHAYERFAVDGVTYLIDGGGGAVLYDPDEDLEDVRAARPEEIALRQAASRSHGTTIAQVDADGALTLTRYAAEDGAMQDRVVIMG